MQHHHRPRRAPAGDRPSPQHLRDTRRPALATGARRGGGPQRRRLDRDGGRGRLEPRRGPRLRGRLPRRVLSRSRPTSPPPPPTTRWARCWARASVPPVWRPIAAAASTWWTAPSSPRVSLPGGSKVLKFVEPNAQPPPCVAPEGPPPGLDTQVNDIEITQGVQGLGVHGFGCPASGPRTRAFGGPPGTSTEAGRQDGRPRLRQPAPPATRAGRERPRRAHRCGAERQAPRPAARPTRRRPCCAWATRSPTWRSAPTPPAPTRSRCPRPGRCPPGSS